MSLTSNGAVSQQNVKQFVENAGDAVAATVTVASVMKWITPIAALFTIVWTGIRLYELITGRKFATSRIARAISKVLNLL